MNAEDKRVAAKQALESKYTRVNKLKQDRELRMQNLKDKMAQIGLDPEWLQRDKKRKPHHGWNQPRSDNRRRTLG